MACATCGNRRRRLQLRDTVKLPDPTPISNTMSAAKLTAHGWVRTCVECGKVSEPSAFADTVEQPCNCGTVENPNEQNDD